MEQFNAIFGLTNEQTDALVQSGTVSIREFGKRQVLMNSDDDMDGIGIMLSGAAFLESMNLDGQRRLVDYYGPQDIFWRKCFPDMESGLYYVIARSKCRVAFVSDRKLTARHGAHGMRAKLLDYILTTAQRRALMHMDVLGQRTLRQKLLSYFAYLSRQKESDTFMLPFSFTDCADYLAADRSAMMRELGRMKEEGLLETEGKKIVMSVIRAMPDSCVQQEDAAAAEDDQ